MKPYKNDKDSIVIIGLGKVGTAIGFLLRSAGYPVLGIVDQSIPAAAKALSYTGGQIYTIPSIATLDAECIIITTVDDAIANVCEKIAEAGVIKPGNKVIHMSGVGGLDILDPARIKGAYVASIHPIQSFADIESAIKNLPGSVFGITADAAINAWSVNFVKDIGGKSFFVDESDKPLYHAAACIASNYLTVLLHMVIEIYKILGLDQEDAIKAVRPLVRGTLNNIEVKGPTQALTGPIARGDLGTIRKHLQVFREKIPHYTRAYCELGQIAVDLGLLKGSIDSEKAEAIKKILKGELGND